MGKSAITHVSKQKPHNIFSFSIAFAKRKKAIHNIYKSPALDIRTFVQSSTFRVFNDWIDNFTKSDYKFWDVKISKNLSWTKQFEALKSELSKRIGINRCLSHHLPKAAMKKNPSIPCSHQKYNMR
jgi:uncharacterized protein YdeI (YjbR/CyaY-like superfamily)